MMLNHERAVRYLVHRAEMELRRAELAEDAETWRYHTLSAMALLWRAVALTGGGA